MKKEIDPKIEAAKSKWKPKKTDKDILIKLLINEDSLGIYAENKSVFEKCNDDFVRMAICDYLTLETIKAMPNSDYEKIHKLALCIIDLCESLITGGHGKDVLRRICDNYDHFINSSKEEWLIAMKGCK
jgi:hypothetical protein